MNPTVVVGATALGAGLGIGSGWLAVFLERVEHLEEEEAEERQQFERERAIEVGGPAVADTDTPWQGDRYGWTWLEGTLSPILGAASFGLFAAHEPVGSGLGVHLIWMAVFVHVVAFDLKHRLILNRITYPTTAIALVLAPVTPGLTLGRAFAGAAAVSLFFLIQSLVSRGRIGLGDAKLGALIGAMTGVSLDGGPIRALYAVIYAVFFGGGAAILLLVTRLRGRKDPIPYGPFLCAGAALILYQSPG